MDNRIIKQQLLLLLVKLSIQGQYCNSWWYDMDNDMYLEEMQMQAIQDYEYNLAVDAYESDQLMHAYGKIE